MAANSRIEWTDHTFNPWIGCTAVSPACDNCYAERKAKRFRVAWGARAARRAMADSTWRQPLAWNRRAAREGRRYRVFCASMADVFDNQVPLFWRDRLWESIAATPHLDWLLLTKRPQNIRGMLPDCLTPAPNVWLGTTAENQEEADRRIPVLLATPATRHFISCEPLLGPLDVSRWLSAPFGVGGQNVGAAPRIGWVIAGGESGPHARASHPAWFRSLRDQCQSPGVPFFFKQWGEWAPAQWKPTRRDGEGDDAYRTRADAEGATAALMHGTGYIHTLSHAAWSLERDIEAPGIAVGIRRWGKAAAGALLDGREWREVPHA